MYMYYTSHVSIIRIKLSVQCQKKEGANPGQLFYQQGAAKSLPGTAGLISS